MGLKPKVQKFIQLVDDSDGCLKCLGQLANTYHGLLTIMVTARRKIKSAIWRNRLYANMKDLQPSHSVTIDPPYQYTQVLQRKRDKVNMLEVNLTAKK